VTAHHDYLAVLGAGSIEELEEHIVATISKEIERTYGDVLPIRLSRIAAAFNIKPRPVFDSTIAHGRLSFDPESQLFTIHLGSSEIPQPRDTTPEHLFDARVQGDPAMTARLRFTYAHEMAHRFLYVKREDSWVRALGLSYSAKHASALGPKLRRLTIVEEQLCNRIAGRILVPERRLASYLTEQFSIARNEIELSRLLEILSQKFLVSRECMFVQMQRLVRRGAISVPQSFCALMVRKSKEKGTGGIATSKLRVKVGIIPNSIEDYEIVPIFPGLSVEQLGGEFASFVHRLSSNEGECCGGKMSVPITLMHSPEYNIRKPLQLLLNGSWSGQTKPNSSDNLPILIWGTLKRLSL
jgi:Zn-dependent peptidase ImmA (M78 family)